ncbi:polysaccharide lyase 8 family protein [Actinomadura gamaensis]|uniref:Polysaccharide lyase 8 family protein n=1 Tax=Actinomadura gamaensis TaxID=1763541 RepID=A0ABV9TX55_9ACTN
MQRWHDLVTGGSAIDPAQSDTAAALERLDTQVEGFRSSLVTASDRTYLWPDQTGADDATTAASAQRLLTMATAFATKGSRFTGDTLLATLIADALRWLHDQRYHPGMPETGNWWNWEIGTPSRVLDSVMLLGPAAPDALREDLVAAVAAWVPDPAKRKVNGVTETGANRTDKAWITVRRGLLAGDPAAIALGRDALSQVFPYVTSGDGFYRDGSFIQHTYIPYIGTYGGVLFAGLSSALAVLAGSPWDVTDQGRANVFDWISRSVEPMVFRGQMMAHVRGRAISRQSEDDHADARGLMMPLTGLAAAASPQQRAHIAAMLAEWVASDTYAPVLASLPAAQIANVRKLIDGVRRRGDLIGHVQFPANDRLVHSRPGYVFAVSARSSRIAAYESGNQENRTGWYTGEGVTYLYTGDGASYNDGYWPTVDMYRLAGTTTATRETYPRANHDGNWASYLGPDDWVGGAWLDRAGAYGMAFTAQRDPVSKQPIDLRGRKSWFAIDDVVVALGAGITATGVAAQTTIENRMVDASARFVVDGRRTTPERADLSRARWAHLDGTGGYILPRGLPGRWSATGLVSAGAEPVAAGDGLRGDRSNGSGGDTTADPRAGLEALAGARLRGIRERRTGRWSDIGAGSRTAPGDEVTREFITFWFDHGDRPSDARYAYYLLPGRSAARTASYAAELRAGKGVRIGDNTPSVQSVQGEGFTAANFWTAAETLKTVQAEQPCSFVMREHGGELEIAVSDPTQKQKELRFEVARRTLAVLHADPGVTVTALGPQLSFRVDVSQARGVPLRLRVRFAR